MILIVDNYDSFTYNLVQYVGALGASTVVVPNDRTSVDDVLRRNPKGLIIGSGAGRPEDAGCCVDLVRGVSGRVPLLGVGLGHRCIAVAFGGALVEAREVVHGKAVTVEHDGQGLFAGLSSPFVATRYDSAVVGDVNVPTELQVTARFVDGEIAGLRHEALKLEGIQFDPASVLTVNGQHIVQNFLAMTETVRAA